MAIGRTQMETQLQGNRKMKKYQAGMDVMSSPRPKMRPEDMKKMAAMKKMRPKARPAKKMRPMVEEGSTRSPDNINMDERAARGEMMPKMNKGGKVKKMMGGGMAKAYKGGGKVRGYGMARGGKACKMR
tara:strand:+ start:142 stop:528 length:387 start_codon:yes stop_codon:yes gene_type:complete